MAVVRSLLALLVLATATLPAWAQVAISPPIMELRLDEGPQVNTLRLHNFEAKDKQVVVSVANWTQGPDGAVQVIPPTELSLDRWVIVSPLKFTLKARSSQTVRVAVRPAVQLAAGEHRAMIYFDEILSPPEEGQAKLRGRFRIGAAVYAYQGAPQRAGRIEALAIDGTTLRGELTSTGTAHARLGGFFGIWPANKFPGLAASPLATLSDAPNATALPTNLLKSDILPSLSVMPGTRRSLAVPLVDLEPGEYIVEVRANLSGVPAEAKALRLVVPKPAPGR